MENRVKFLKINMTLKSIFTIFTDSINNKFSS